jgi:hypothetical protein
MAAAAAEVPMDIETALDTIRHSDLLYVLSRLILSVSVIKLNIYFISSREFRVSVEGDVVYVEIQNQQYHHVPSCPQHSPLLKSV